MAILVKSIGLLNRHVRHEVRTLRTLTLLGSASMSIYRRLYEQAYGPIPKDSEGRSYDIHHIDGDHNNNELSNLVALSVVDHFWEHWINGDYGACYKITKRLRLTPQEQSELGRLSNKERLENGTHNFYGGYIQSKTQRRLVENGEHIFVSSEWQTENAKKRVVNGSHNFLGENNPSHRRMKEGTHNFQIKKECPVCGKVMSEPNFIKWGHGKNCKRK